MGSTKQEWLKIFGLWWVITLDNGLEVLARKWQALGMVCWMLVPQAWLLLIVPCSLPNTVGGRGGSALSHEFFRNCSKQPVLLLWRNRNSSSRPGAGICQASRSCSQLLLPSHGNSKLETHFHAALMIGQLLPGSGDLCCSTSWHWSDQQLTSWSFFVFCFSLTLSQQCYNDVIVLMSARILRPHAALSWSGHWEFDICFNI